MRTWKRILRRLLFPSACAVLLGVLASAALLIYAFGFAREHNPLTFLAYTVSFYTLVILCARAPRLAKGISALLRQNPYIHRYLTDFPFRTHVSLYLSLGVNLLYAVLKLFLGVHYRSVWFGTLGVYYTLLTTMRFLLLRHLSRSAPGREPVSEWKRYRLCGAILIPTTFALAGVVVLVLKKHEGFAYPGHLIYLAALYAFYAVIAAAIPLIRYRKYPSPIMTAAKVIRLAAALVSMFSLEIAMLSQFGGSEEAAFRLVMIISTGAGVCVIISGTAIWMIVRAGSQLKTLQPSR